MFLLCHPRIFSEATALEKMSGIHYYSLILLFITKLIVRFNRSNGFPLEFILMNISTGMTQRESFKTRRILKFRHWHIGRSNLGEIKWS